MKAATVTIATGSGSSNSLGKISFTGATSVSLDNVFTNKYKHYRILIKAISSSGNNELWFQFRQGGSNQTLEYYGIVHYGIYTGTFFGANARSNGTEGWCSVIGTSGISSSALEIEANAGYSTMSMAGQFTGTGAEAVGGYSAKTLTAPDGFRIYPSAASTTGTIQVFGYNE